MIISVLSKEVSLHIHYTGVGIYRPVADLFDDLSKQLSSLMNGFPPGKERRTDSRLDSDSFSGRVTRIALNVFMDYDTVQKALD